MPDPNRCTVPAFIRIVGSTGGVPDLLGEYVVTVRDFTANPVAGAAVTLDFGGCADFRISPLQGPGTAAVCPDRVTGVTNAAGEARFIVVGGGLRSACGGNCVADAIGCVTVSSENVLLGVASALVYDLDGATAGGDGISVLDPELVGNEILCADGFGYRPICDYNPDGMISPLDLAAYLDQLLALAIRGQGSAGGTSGFGHCPPAAPGAASVRDARAVAVPDAPGYRP